MTTCSGNDGDASSRATSPARTIARVGAAYSYARTVLSFGGDLRASFSRHAVIVSGETPVGERGVAQLGAGGIADGSLDTDAHHEVGPGWLMFGSYAYRIVDPRGHWPFLLGSLTAGVSAARTAAPTGESAKFTAYDVRAGLTLGESFGPATPYLAARVFGGPVLWTQRGQSLTGTDKYHYQPAAGLVLALRPFDISAEWAFVGEQAVTVGAGVAF